MDLRTQVYEDRPWLVGQWQNGEFYGVAPADRAGAHKAVVAEAGVEGGLSTLGAPVRRAQRGDSGAACAAPLS